MFVQLTRDFLGRKAGERIDLAEPDALALVASGTASAVNEDIITPQVHRALEQALGGISGQVQSAVDSALREFATATTRSRRHAVPAIFGEDGQGDPKKTFGRFLLAIRQGDRKVLEEMGSRYVEWSDVEQKAAMSTQTGTTGGYLVPTEFYDRLMQLVVESSLVRPRATIVPMAHREMDIPALDVVTAPSAGDTAFLGGVVVRWSEEASTINQTEPILKQIKLTNYELTGYSKVSNSLMADSAVGLDALLMQIFSRAIAWYEDYAFLRGNGVGKPLGILNWAGLISVARSGASQVALADVAGMYGRLLPGGTRQSVLWGVHPTVLVKLLTMTGGDNLIFLGNDVTGKPRWQILGHDVRVSEKLPALNTAGDILLLDLQHYLIGDRQQIEIAYSEHIAFLTNQSVWRFVSRVAGQPWLRDKVTLADGSNTLSPFVALAAG
jgi:HK97 family phage major capsid protein